MAIVLSASQLVKQTMIDNDAVAHLFRIGLHDALSDLSFGGATPFADSTTVPPRIVEMGGPQTPNLPYIEYQYMVEFDLRAGGRWFSEKVGVKNSTLVASGSVDRVAADGRMIWDYGGDFLNQSLPVRATQWVENNSTGATSFISNVLDGNRARVEDAVFAKEGEQYSIFLTDVLVTYPVYSEALLSYSINAGNDTDARAITDRCAQYFMVKAQRDLDSAIDSVTSGFIVKPLASVVMNTVRNTNFVYRNQERKKKRDFTVKIDFAAEAQTIEPNLQGINYTIVDDVVPVVNTDSLKINDGESAEQLKALLGA